MKIQKIALISMVSIAFLGCSKKHPDDPGDIFSSSYCKPFVDGVWEVESAGVDDSEPHSHPHIHDLFEAKDDDSGQAMRFEHSRHHKLRVLEAEEKKKLESNWRRMSRFSCSTRVVEGKDDGKDVRIELAGAVSYGMLNEPGSERSESHKHYVWIVYIKVEIDSDGPYTFFYGGVSETLPHWQLLASLHVPIEFEALALAAKNKGERLDYSQLIEDFRDDVMPELGSFIDMYSHNGKIHGRAR